MDLFIDYFSRVAGYNWWVVAIEIFSIALVVYWAIDFLEGTRGERLFRGVIFILISGVLILNLIVERFSFERLQYLYKGFLIAVLIIAVTAFQPEVRRALMRIGRTRFLSGTSRKLTQAAEELISAVCQLSLIKTGAIIVIEKRVALGEFIETGVRLDAIVNSELLRTIFYSGTALHDMAVIISNSRIVAARVQLPLAEADSVDGIELGSRHRAAVGLTSGCDAVVIVVSEETGIISVAVGGQLKRNISASGLEGYLVEAMD
ncbi:MAG: diadenylate cyclase CdaA [Planctomycetes bacterium]|nr:diadenylate cyclase CdaA [Planctomycetota bacterium]